MEKPPTEKQIIADVPNWITSSDLDKAVEYVQGKAGVKPGDAAAAVRGSILEKFEQQTKSHTDKLDEEYGKEVARVIAANNRSREASRVMNEIRGRINDAIKEAHSRTIQLFR